MLTINSYYGRLKNKKILFTQFIEKKTWQFTSYKKKILICDQKTEVLQSRDISFFIFI